MARAPAKGNWLIFVDTNVLLDFYRLGGESADRALKALEKHKDSIILNDQVYMEFMKNRQKVINETMKGMEKPKMLSVPPIIAERKPFRKLQSSVKTAQGKYTEVRKAIENILLDPSRHDPVFQAINRIYGHNGSFHVKRPNKERFTIRNAARKRFILGYPPRKREDTSIGDAINWESIIHCAKLSKDNHHILIVSRDGDYGMIYDNASVLNDWLRKEFKDRVSRKRKIELTNKLTYALKLLDEVIPPEDEEAENILLRGEAALPATDIDDDDGDKHDIFS